MGRRESNGIRAVRHALSSSDPDLYCTGSWSRPQPDFRRLTPRRFPKFRHGISWESVDLARLIHRFYFEQKVARSRREVLVLQPPYPLEILEKLIFFHSILKVAAHFDN